nr:MAG TPA: hypothetical protein [Caudoviricetes sp.]
MLGNRFFVTSRGNGSISLAQTGTIPAIWPANSKPPLPLKREPIVILFLILSPFSWSWDSLP